ncbi:MAG: hypothetical protein QOF30_1858 [Acidimicrobiaceae bacterium]|nr:hypothetical protein [Acidimicrobiaceae bacterium]
MTTTNPGGAQAPIDPHDTAVARIRSYVSTSSRTSQEAADFVRSHIDAVCEALNVATHGPPVVQPLLLASVDAYVADVVARAPTAASRCWSQWFFRVASRVTHEGCKDVELLGQAIQATLDRLPPSPVSMPWLVSDLKASLAGALAWELLDQADDWQRLQITDGEFLELFHLYVCQLHFDADAIMSFLAGHRDRGANPIKAAFNFFAQSVVGDSKRAQAALIGNEITEHSMPLAAAKLIAYVLHAAPPQRTSYIDGGGVPTELVTAFETALGVWRAHGGGVQFYTAQAGFAAMVDDTSGVVMAINNAVRLLSESGRVGSSDFLVLIRLRSELLERIGVSKQLTGVAALRQDADHALAVAKESSTQIPTIVGLFAAVIALVIGSSQASQNLPTRGRILVVAALGTVLLMFVIGLAGIVRFMAGTKVSIERLGLFIGAGVLFAGLVLTLLYVVAG